MTKTNPRNEAIIRKLRAWTYRVATRLVAEEDAATLAAINEPERHPAVDQPTA